MKPDLNSLLSKAKWYKAALDEEELALDDEMDLEVEAMLNNNDYKQVAANAGLNIHSEVKELEE